MASKWKNRSKLVRPARVFAAPDPTLESTAKREEAVPAEPEAAEASEIPKEAPDQNAQDQNVAALAGPGCETSVMDEPQLLFCMTLCCLNMAGRH